MTTPDFLVTPLASSSSASVGKLGVNAGDSLSVESEAAAGVNFPAQLEEVASELSWLPEKQSSFAGLKGEKADAGGETNLSKELLSLEQGTEEQDSPGFSLSLPVSTAPMAADFGHFPFSSMVEAFESSSGNADLPEVIGSDSQSAAQNSLLITRDIDGAPSGIFPDSSEPVNSPVNVILPSRPQNLINQEATYTPEASALTGAVLGPALKLPVGGAGLPAPPSQLSFGASKEAVLPAPLHGKESGTENSLPIGEDLKLSSGLDVPSAEMDFQLFLGHRNSSTSLRGDLPVAVATEAPAPVQGDSQVLMAPAPLPDTPSLAASSTSLNPGFTEVAVSNLSASRDNPMGLTLESAIQEPEWGKELSERMTWLVKDKLQFAELRLNPPQLGPLEARINMHHDEASITFHAPQAAVREALEAALPRLRESFAEQGLNLVNVDVSQQGFSEQQRQAAQSGNLQATLAESPETVAPEDSAGGTRLFVQQGGVDYYA